MHCASYSLCLSNETELSGITRNGGSASLRLRQPAAIISESLLHTGFEDADGFFGAAQQ